MVKKESNAFEMYKTSCVQKSDKKYKNNLNSEHPLPIHLILLINKQKINYQ